MNEGRPGGRSTAQDAASVPRGNGHNCAQLPMPGSSDPVAKKGEFTSRARKLMSLIGPHAL